MDTISSLLAPVSAAAQHLGHALRRVQGDFQNQALKSGKVVRRDIQAARGELKEAVSRLGEATDSLRDSISSTKAGYAESLRDKYHAGAESVLDTYNAGADYARSLKARANALTLSSLGTDRRYLTRNNVLMAGAAIGVGYVLLRALRKLRTTAVESAAAEADDVASKTKPRARKRVAKAAKVAKTAVAKVANGSTTDIPRAH